MDCQREDAKGGGAICKGGYGKQKQYCKECRISDRHAVTLRKKTRILNQQYDHNIDICPDHDSGKHRSYCFDCQKAGMGGGALCRGGHGKRKYNCKECHPDEHEANRLRTKVRYNRKKTWVVSFVLIMGLAD